MAASSEADIAAKLIERLLTDPAFRARFRRDPPGACREAGLHSLAQEMSVGGGKAMHTLDMRESKSSLAGVMMAAAMEGDGIYQFTENVLPHLEEVPGHVADVLSRVDLPALPSLHKGGGGAGGGAAGGKGGGGGGGAARGGGRPRPRRRTVRSCPSRTTPRSTPAHPRPTRAPCQKPAAPRPRPTPAPRRAGPPAGPRPPPP